MPRTSITPPVCFIPPPAHQVSFTSSISQDLRHGEYERLLRLYRLLGSPQGVTGDRATSVRFQLCLLFDLETGETLKSELEDKTESSDSEDLKILKISVCHRRVLNSSLLPSLLSFPCNKPQTLLFQVNPIANSVSAHLCVFVDRNNITHYTLGEMKMFVLLKALLYLELLGYNCFIRVGLLTPPPLTAYV